jgi:uncharacterized protein involved in exopolysaccharide biosynthesis
MPTGHESEGSRPGYGPLVDDEVNVLRLLSVPLQRWRVVAGVPLLAAFVAVAISYVIPSWFTATTRFVPEVRSQSRLPSGLATIAGQFGVSISSDPTQSPRFYAQVVKSRAILERILLTRYPDPQGRGYAADSATLLQIFRVHGKTIADSLDRGVKKLGELISVRTDDQTNIVSLDVTSRSPMLAAAIANNAVEYLNDFNTKTRQSQARERRKFIEERLTVGEQDLRLAEEQLKRFYEVNRSWQHAPQLVFEEGRLRRQVEIRQELYLTLRREYESARIEEVNNTPVMTLIDSAVPPQQRSSPRRILFAIIAMVFASTFGLLWAFGAAHLDRIRRQDRATYDNFSRLLHGIRDEIRHIPRAIVRRRAGD